MKDKKQSLLRQRFLNKYRLVILKEDSYEEKFSYRLSGLNIFLLSSLSAGVIISLTTSLIAFTPLKEYIPGYDSTLLRANAAKNIEIVDSLTRVVYNNQKFINSVGAVISGDIQKNDIETNLSSTINPSTKANIKITLEDSVLRKIVEKEDRFNALEPANKKVDFVLFSPVVGKISSNFDPGLRHYGIDIALPLKTPVKSIAAGSVVFSELTVQTGHVIIIKHLFGLVSVYKHNDSGLIRQGDLIESGQVIAFSGNSGEITTGPHLHFELWREGSPVDPTEYINFE